MKVRAAAPASCGELLQGQIGKGEKLISYPINMFSIVTLKECRTPKRNGTRPKAVLGMYKTLSYFGESYRIGDQIDIQIQSDIPIAKGMASSTADIAAAVMATAEFLGKNLSVDELAKICAGIEPTDSTIYQTLTLFDHLEGVRIESFNWSPKLDVLVLESPHYLDTQEFRKKDYSLLRLQNKEKVEKAYTVFRQAYEKEDGRLLGKAATLSALANQNILPKEKLEEIIEVSVRLGCYGVNVAHSGTVIGILFDKKLVEPDELLLKLKERSVPQHYDRIYLTQMIEGGVRILGDE